MEMEYKWRADEELLSAALLWASTRMGSQSRTIHMSSQYFDTADGLLRQHDAALRLRRENDRTVCCMKRHNRNTPAGMRAHEEYECDAATLADGLTLLPEKGAPASLCQTLAQQPLVLLCEVDFRRCAILLQQGDTVCELALDQGEMRRNGRAAPLCEIELEFIAGDETVFHQLAQSLAAPLALVSEPESKLARAMQL